MRGGGEAPTLQFATIESLFRYQSGRVIALGRAMLAALFFVAIWLDDSQPAQAPAETYAILALYAVFAAILCAVTWRNWWLDAKLAAPTHAVDMAVFTIIVFSTDGYTSPFFLFFVLPLLSAAIRWGWRETAFTAVGLIGLYLVAGVVGAASARFELQRFVIRSGHLVILSSLLFWFGMHQRFAGLTFRADDLDAGGTGSEPSLERALRQAMRVTGARRGILLVGDDADDEFEGVRIADGKPQAVAASRSLVRERVFARGLLFDLPRNRALTRTERRRLRFGRAGEILDPAAAAELGLTTGLIAEVRSGSSRGWLVLEQVPHLSTDFVELGEELARAAATIIERQALFVAMEQGAAVRTRLSFARDVHDSVVQFLAGASFRVEAIVRAARSGEAVDSELQDLKRLLLDEQRDIRGFVSALRHDGDFDLAETVTELRDLATRLADQWAIACEVNAEDASGAIPVRLHVDVKQLVREAVANAVRHGQANRVDVSLALADNELRLDVSDNGRGFAAPGGEPPQPRSLKERVEQAKGTLTVASAPGCTRVAVRLPLDNLAA